MTLSNNASDGFVKSLGENGRGVIVTQVFPHERSIAYPMVREAQELAKAKGLTEVSPAMPTRDRKAPDRHCRGLLISGFSGVTACRPAIRCPIAGQSLA